jgi:hypothetical protein
MMGEEMVMFPARPAPGVENPFTNSELDDAEIALSEISIDAIPLKLMFPPRATPFVSDVIVEPFARVIVLALKFIDAGELNTVPASFVVEIEVVSSLILFAELPSPAMPWTRMVPPLPVCTSGIAVANSPIWASLTKAESVAENASVAMVILPAFEVLRFANVLAISGILSNVTFSALIEISPRRFDSVLPGIVGPAGSAEV